MSLRQKAVKGVVWSIVESWGQQAVSAIVFFILARLLGPEAFGLVALASVFIAFVQLFLDQGLSQAIIQREEIEPGHLDTAFWTNVGISSLVTIVTIFCADSVAELFKQPTILPVIRWLSLSFLFGAFSSVQQAIFVRELAFKALATRSLVAILAGGIVGVSMAFMNLGVWSLVGQQLTNSFAQVLVLWWVSDWRPGFKVSREHFVELFSFGINVVGGKIVDFLNRRSDDFLIGYYLGPVALGYYSVAYRLLVISTDLLTGVTAKVAMPTFSKLQKEPERLRSAFYTITQITSLIAFPCFLGMAVLAPELVRSFFGEQWVQSISVMRILTFIGIIHSVYSFNGTVMMAVGKPFWRFALNSISAVANVIAFAFTVRYGIEAVAAAYVIRGYLLSPLSILAIRKLIHISLKRYFGQFVAPVIASLGMLAMILGVKYFAGSWLSLYVLLVLCIVVGAVAYVGGILLIAPKLIYRVVSLARLAVPGVVDKKA